MKTESIKYIVALVLFVTNSYAQKKGDNAIIVNDSSITMDQVRNAFIKEGFSIDKSEKDYLNTELLSKGWLSEKVGANMDKNNIVLRVWVKSDVSIGGLRISDPVLAGYIGSKNGGNMKAFNHLKQIALSITDKIEFKKY
jgi:hypothetical protein